MNNAHKKLLNKRLPSSLGFFVLIITLGITIVLSRNTLIFVSKATVGSEPKNIQLSNISDTSFTISYTTDENAISTLAYGKDTAAGTVVLDDRDLQGSKPTEHRVHFFTVKALTPATKYYYILTSGTQIANNNGKPFEITTATPLTAQPTAQPTLSGTATLNDGSIPKEGIAYVTTDTSQQLAVLLSPDGSYKIPLAQLRTNTLETLAPLKPETVLQLQVITPTDQSKVTLLTSQIDQVPKIVISQNYDFTLNPVPVASLSAQVASGSGFPIFGNKQTASSPEIISPKEAQTYKDQQPVFKGKALPNAEIAITIASQQEISVQLQSDSTGNWQFRPPMALSPGKHTITIKSLDAAGILQTISKSFTVYAAGSKFVEPSVSPIAQPTLITTPSATITLSPTLFPSPTASPTPVILASPSPTVMPNRGPVPPTGSSILVTGIIATVSAIGIGALLFFFSAI